jgi:phage pi2 protein 07
MNELKITHDAGFFSCCTIKLEEILKYFNINKQLPKSVECTQQFQWYKLPKDKNTDVTNHYFKTKETDLKYINSLNITSSTDEQQFSDYTKLNFSDIDFFVDKYFSPSEAINNIIKNIEQKYKLDYENTCVVFYRGNDKARETNMASYSEFIQKAKDILIINPNVIFLIQSDETNFIDALSKALPKVIIFNDEIRHIQKSDSTVDHVDFNNNYKYSLNFLAITIIMSKCKYVICNSGNCSFWIMLYRKNANNICQYLAPKQYIYGCLNKSYSNTQKDFWISNLIK